jgi:hypothetical protein
MRPAAGAVVWGMSDGPNERTHGRWLHGILGLVLLFGAGPIALNQTIRQLDLRCVRIGAEGECTLSLRRLPLPLERQFPPGDLIEVDWDCDDLCWGSIELIDGRVSVGLVDLDSFRAFSQEVDAFAAGRSQELDLRLGPHSLAWLLLLLTLGTGLATLAAFEYGSLEIDEEEGVLRMRTRSLLHWVEVELPLDSITGVGVEVEPTKTDRDVPTSTVRLRLREGPPVRVGRSGDGSADELAAWLRERLPGAGQQRG